MLKVPVKEIYRADELGCPESGIEWLRGYDRATCQLVKSRYTTKIKALAEMYPDECEIVAENEDGSILAHVPLGWVKISPPKKVSESQREAGARNLRKARSI